jgi:autotransporter translocation and assembly factor TamB
VRSTWLRIAVAAAVLACIVVAGAFLAPQFLRGAVTAGAASFGVRAAIGGVDLHFGQIVLRDVNLKNLAGEPIGRIATTTVRYSLRDLLPGGSRAFGLTGLDVENGRLVLIRHADGSYNLPIPKGGPGRGAPTTPFVFDGRIRNVRVDVYDRAPVIPASAHFAFVGVNADMHVATNATTNYVAGLTYVERSGRYPIAGRGMLDAATKTGLQRWSSARLPIAALADFAIHSTSLRLTDGALTQLDARVGTLPGPGGTMDNHISATTQLSGGRVVVAGLDAPLTAVRGPIAVYDDGLLLQGVLGTLAGVQMRLDGGVIGLRSPQLHLTVAGQGDVTQLRTALAQTAKLPLSGRVALDVAVEGAPAAPLVLISARAPAIRFQTYVANATDATLAFDGRRVVVLDASASYRSIAVRAHGRLDLKSKHSAVAFAAAANVPANAIPQTPAMLADLPVDADALAIGDSPASVSAFGAARGSNARDTLAATFHLRGNGTGTIGPVTLAGRDGSLYARAAIDHPHQIYDAYVNATGLRVAMNGVGAAIDADMLAGMHGTRTYADGFAHARNVVTPYGPVAAADARFGTTNGSQLAVALTARGIGALDAIAMAVASYNDGAIDVQNATVAAQGNFVRAQGTVTDLTHGAPAYALDANVHAADLSSIVALARPSLAKTIEGSADARLHAAGRGADVAVSGTLAAPEGAVNGLPFHELHTNLSGTQRAVQLREGGVGIGSTAIAFSGDLTPSQQHLSVAAPYMNAADFNDFFDAGDMLAGQGSLRASATLAGGTVLATNGQATIAGTAVRGIVIGTTRAAWNGNAGDIHTDVDADGQYGNFSAAGSVGVRGFVDIAAHARNVALAHWLPVAGLQVPVTGTASADATVAGTFPNLDTNVRASVIDATVLRLPVQSVSAVLATRAGRGRLQSLAIRAPHLNVDADGAFGLRSTDPLAIEIRTKSDDAAALVNTTLGTKYDASGSLAMQTRIAGTRDDPMITDDVTLTKPRYGNFTATSLFGRITATRRVVSLSGAGINFERGRILADATMPIRLAPFSLDPGGVPISARITADDIELSNFVSLMPKNTKITGRIDGTVQIAGDLNKPELGGSLAFTGGSFSGPAESIPITDTVAQVAFDKQTITLNKFAATAGGGGVAANGYAWIPNFRDPRDASFQLSMRTTQAQFDLPQYFKGKLDANVALSHKPGGSILASGSVSVASARIPLTALYNPKPAGGTAPVLPPVAFDLQINVGRDVRVQSPNIDLGATGSLQVAGTLAKPQLSGAFTSTGGTVSFLRDFRVQSGTVTFDPNSGVVPDVDATATTHVSNPSTDVTLHVTGPATNLNLALASDPQYDREQILGLLVNAQSLGAVRGVAATGGGSFSAGSAIANLAAGQLNTLFTRNLLEPLSVAVGDTLGLENFQITNDLQTGLGISAVKKIGDKISFIFAETFNETRRTAYTVQYRPNISSQLQMTAYTSLQQNPFATQPFLTQTTSTGTGISTSTIPIDTGGNGIDFKYQRTFPPP